MSKKCLTSEKKYWINYYDSFANGYNLTSGGDGGNTIAKYSDEQLKQYKEKKKVLHFETAPKGESAPRSKLTNAQVLEIIDRMLAGDYNVDIAKDYNVNYSTIHDIRAHNTWNCLTEGIVFPHPSKSFNKGAWGKPVNQYNKDGEFIATYSNAREAERITGCPFKNISAVCHGKKQTCLGYIWRFAE